MTKPAPGYYGSSHYWWLPGAVGSLIILCLVGLPLLALFSFLDRDTIFEPLSNPWHRRVIAFSFYQGFLSTLLSVVLAIPVARALSRRGRFPGRTFLIKLFSVALIVPTIVAVFGIVTVYGQKGWLNQVLASSGVEASLNIYGLSGILLAHVFFNLPMSVRILLQGLDTIPETQWKLAAQLGMSPWTKFRLLEWPAITRYLPGLCLLVFTLCFTSFAIVMTLGGGPRATTIEVAIYQALRFDFDLGTAVALATVQLLICSLLMFLTTRFSSGRLVTSFSDRQVRRFESDGWMIRCVDILLIGLAFLFVLLPLAAIFMSAINPALGRVLMHSSTIGALFNTIWVACLSGVLSVGLGCLLISSSRHLGARLGREQSARTVELVGLVILVIPPVVLGTGLFLLLRQFADVFSMALLLVILVNALMGLPFVLRIVSDPAVQSARQHDRLCESLGLTGLKRLRIVEWPVLRKPLGLAAAIATTLSAGDLTVIALFGSERVATLPLLLYQRMGSYRLFEASATAMILLLVCLALFWAIERLIGGRHAAT